MDRSLFILRLFCWSSLWLVGLSFPHQFHFVKEFKSWTEAQSICRKKYTDLATVDDMEDMRRLLESVNGTYNGSVWLGLYDDIEKSWRWSLEDPEFYKEGEKDFRNWVTTQSNVFQREPVCVMFKDGVWHFFPCETQLSFVCFDERENAMEGLVLISEPEQNWTEARQYCRQHHTDLASIRNHKENSRLARILRSNFVWIGLHRTRMWSDQSNSSFRYWKTEAPYMNLKHLDPSCTAVSFDDVGRWTDENCDITLPFICYTALSGIPHQYYFVQASKNWTDAQRFCRRYYTDLATVDGIKDMKSLLETANGTYHGSAWIGLFDDLKTSWQWSLEDPQFYKEGERDFRKWFEHPLNENGTDFCALMLIQNQPLYEGQWIDRSCEERHQFVCYNENSTTPGTYVPISEPKTWTEAQSYCREHFVDLASVRNQQENMDIFTKTSENIIINFSDGLWPVWIGLYRTKTWSDKSNSSFTYWMEGEPDNGRNSVDDLLDQHCTVVSLGHWGQWSDENCLSTFPFICYSLNSTAEPLPAPGPTLEEPPATSDPAPSTKRGDAHTAVAVIGLRAQVSSQKDQSEAEIEKLLVMKLQEELLRRGIPHKFTLRVKSIHKIIL